MNYSITIGRLAGFTDMLYYLDILGTIAFAASGALTGVRKRMDLLGVVVLGIITATGGGILRDVLMNDLPPFCFKNELYLYLAIGTSLIVFVVPQHFDQQRKLLLILDALGLGTFAVIGTTKAFTYHLGFIGAVIMGVVTATFGGLVRDVLCNDIPLILQREIYATACIVGCTTLCIMRYYSFDQTMALTFSATLIIAIRSAAILRGWQLPRKSV
ncbi:MAG: trimeric intracellular cation channel family protein [Desulfuromonadaceae bacterium]|nr:trimeric intracellular cation channel family protein [Desulfuromonadaceae bacterium]MDD5105447.1 trimeric intracellular cation channel family protein [Desulfuromonadaceae bacterium]